MSTSALFVQTAAQATPTVRPLVVDKTPSVEVVVAASLLAQASVQLTQTAPSPPVRAVTSVPVVFVQQHVSATVNAKQAKSVQVECVSLDVAPTPIVETTKHVSSPQENRSVAVKPTAPAPARVIKIVRAQHVERKRCVLTTAVPHHKPVRQIDSAPLDSSVPTVSVSVVVVQTLTAPQAAPSVMCPQDNKQVAVLPDVLHLVPALHSATPKHVRPEPTATPAHVAVQPPPSVQLTATAPTGLSVQTMSVQPDAAPMQTVHRHSASVSKPLAHPQDFVGVQPMQIVQQATGV